MFRVRHHDTLARLEIGRDEMARALEPEINAGARQRAEGHRLPVREPGSPGLPHRQPERDIDAPPRVKYRSDYVRAPQRTLPPSGARPVSAGCPPPRSRAARSHGPFFPFFTLVYRSGMQGILPRPISDLVRPGAALVGVRRSILVDVAACGAVLGGAAPGTLPRRSRGDDVLVSIRNRANCGAAADAEHAVPLSRAFS